MPASSPIVSSAPTRIDLAGGTIDIWPLYLFHDGAATVNAAIDAQRDFWLAEADLDMALIGKPSMTPMAGPSKSMSAGDGEAH